MDKFQVATIRKAKESDLAEILNLIHKSFSSRVESDLVKELFFENDVLLNLVYEPVNSILGNVIISKITMEPDFGLFCGAIGPLAVLPRHQLTGVGSKLMKEAIIKSEKMGLDALFVLGNPSYYSKFNFSISSLKTDYNPAHFQELQLTKNCLNNLKAKITYTDAFLKV